MSSTADDTVSDWPGDVRDFVEYKQETAYRLLGDRMGLHSDPADVRLKLLGERQPSVKLSPEALRDKLGLTGKFTPEQWEQTKQLIAQDEANPTQMRAPTRYEDPRTYRLMNEIRALLEEDAADLGQEIDFPPFLASLPSGDVNARISIISDDSPPVMFFEQGLFQYLRDFAALASWAAPTLPPNDLSDQTLAAIPPVHTMPFQASALFAASLRSYVVDGNPARGSGLVPRPAGNAFLSHVLFGWMIKFVFVHEFAHLQLGHLKRDSAGRDAAWNCEHEADVAAAAFVTSATAKSGSWALGFWACDLVLIAFNFLDRTLSLFEFGGKSDWISNTHPDPITRRNTLHAMVPQEIPHVARAAGGNLAAMNQSLFQGLWEIALPDFMMARTDGARPSPIWSERIARSMAAKKH